MLNTHVNPASVNAGTTAHQVAGSQNSDKAPSINKNSNGNAPATAGNVNNANPGVVVTTKESKKGCCIECMPKNVTIGGNDEPIPSQSKEAIDKAKSGAEKVSSDQQSVVQKESKKGCCVECMPKNVSIGGDDEPIPAKSKEAINSQKVDKQEGRTANTEVSSKNSATQSTNKEQGFTRPVEILGSSMMRIPAEAKQKIVTERLATRFGVLTPKNDSALVKQTAGYIQSAPTAEVLQKEVSRLNIQTSTVTVLTNNAAVNKEVLAVKQNVTGVSILARVSNAAPVLRNTEVTLQTTQAMQKFSDKVIKIFGEISQGAKEVKLSALQKAMGIDDPKLLKDLLQVKTNTYGFVSMNTLRAGIEKSFLNRSDLDKMLKALFGQSFNPEAIEENLDDPMLVYAEYLKEQRRLKILKEHEEQNGRNKQQQKEDQPKKQPKNLKEEEEELHAV